MNILVSACLLGLDCRYSGTNGSDDRVISLKNKHHLIPVCPEQMGGMPTPRPPVELKAGRAIDQNGMDHTAEFEKGAEEVAKLATLFDCKVAILKSRSPSCGRGWIYDGSFSRNLIPGNGLTADKLEKSGVKVYGEENQGDRLFDLIKENMR